MSTTTHPPVSSQLRPWWPWLLTALAFPPAGYIAHEVVGRVDDVGAAVLNGVVVGAIVGTVQWLVLRRRGAPLEWIAATTIGLGVGLGAGAALVGYDTSLGALAVMGAVSGLAVGLAQAVRFPPLRRHVLVWTLGTGALWAIAWVVTTGWGIKVEDQWPVFGISGALVFAFLQSLLINRFVPDTEPVPAAVVSGRA